MFTFTFSEEDNDTTVEMTTNAIFLGRVLEIMTRFLKACGFEETGDLSFIDEDEIEAAYKEGREDAIAERGDDLNESYKNGWNDALMEKGDDGK